MNRIVIALLKPFSLHPGDSDDVDDFLLLFPERNGILTAQ